jgi:hypothetical protein
MPPSTGGSHLRPLQQNILHLHYEVGVVHPILWQSLDLALNGSIIVLELHELPS